MTRPELLAPAGGPEAGYAALAYGADAVYLGLKRFSARSEAVNFGLEELDSLAAYARTLSPRRRVYVTVNTLVLESEIPEVVSTTAALRELGVDALIVQDLGLARLLRRYFPSLELHASTQMAVHNLHGVEALARLGMRRAVVARELTLAEIRGLCSQGDVEIECFVHGAVCYAYSGLCLFSSHALGRSANRGRCAYVCGGSFARKDRRERPAAAPSSALPFAMKDLCLADRLPELAEAGVASLKIEGRKKSPLYVAAVTDYYRRLLDRKSDPEERRSREEDLRTIFSRPWTELYLDSERQNACGDPDRLGHRGALVGTVSAVRGNRRTGTSLVFRTSRALEAHDGLQIEVPGLVKPYGFPISELRVAGRKETRFAVDAGAEVEVRLPPDHPAIPIGASIHCTSSNAVKRVFRWVKPREGEYRRRWPVDGEIRVRAERVDLSLRSGTGARTAQVLEGPFEPARAPGAAAEGARAAFQRLGATPFSLGRLDIEDEQGLSVAPSQWNRLRRTATDALERETITARESEVRAILDTLAGEAAPRGLEVSPPRRWSLRADRLDLFDAFDADDWDAASEVVFSLDGLGEDPVADVEALAGLVGRGKIRLSLPPIVRSRDEGRLRPVVSRLLADGWHRWEIANLAGWGQLGLLPGEGSGLNVTADWPLYAVNSSAGNALLELGLTGFTLSPEDGAENMRALLAAFGARATVVVYQHPPLFVSETCPRATLAGACPGTGRCRADPMDLVSDFGDHVRVLSRRCRTVVVARAPLCLSREVETLSAAGGSSLRVDFQYADLDSEAARDTWRRVRAGEPIPGSHPGNYHRELA